MALRNRGNRLVLDFRMYLPDGRRVRCVEAEGPDTKRNRQRVMAKWKAIRYAMDSGRFDYLEFFPNGAKAKFFRPADGETLSSFWFRWIATKTVGEQTEYDYRLKFGTYIEPTFGASPIGDITTYSIAAWRKGLLDSGLKGSSVNVIGGVLKQVLAAAVDAGIIQQSPYIKIKSLREDAAEISPFSFEEMRHLLDVLLRHDKVMHDLVLFWGRTGMRPGELCALRWEHIDFFNGKVLVRQSRHYSGMTGPTKTRTSIRDIDIGPVVIDALKRQRERTGLAGGWVWCQRGGQQMHQTYLREQFRRICRLAGLAYRPPKQMRHTFATQAIAAGESITWVARQLGHSSVEITAKRYNRFVPNLTRRDGSAMERMLNDGDPEHSAEGNGQKKPQHGR